MSKKKGSRRKKRDLERYPALNPRLNARTRFEVLDMDYLKKLEDSDLEYMNKFMGEYVSGAFKKDDTGEYSSENFHKTQEERRECYTRNNTRNRCGLTISNATGQTVRADNINELIDNMTDSEHSANKLSDFIMDEYDGDYELLEQDLLIEMWEDYNRCLNPKTEADKKLSQTNYGKMLFLKFNNSKLD
jgi:hypothetical protein